MEVALSRFLWRVLQVCLLLPGNEFSLDWQGRTVVSRGAILRWTPPWLGQTGIRGDESLDALWGREAGHEGA